jgi:hypothetical protein
MDEAVMLLALAIRRGTVIYTFRFNYDLSTTLPALYVALYYWR